MTSTSGLESVDLSNYSFAPSCDRCPKPAAVVAQGCADKHPVLMCDDCLSRGLEVIAMFVRMWQKVNKRVCVCGDCYRPILTLDTHLEVRRLLK
ncbi:hydrolase [Mycobacterium phage MosMoris]|uniref:Hydrolase n=1 Tax=Mycobacterium phage MosMoris TaxID=1471542 RepID=A0A023ZWE9_9CAUD|nr:hydrolase [Mycobacterium phage MosMoris]AHY84141.1 hydrolase [Mycobacterium phage MosMoris]